MLEVRGLSAGYGDLIVVRDVSLDVQQGEFVAIIGSNAAGKSTLIRSIAGLLPRVTGTILFDGQPVERLAPYELAQRGLAVVLEHSVIAKMTVHDNLLLGAYRSQARADIDRTLDQALALFPILAERRGQLAVDGELHEPAGRQALRTQLDGLRLEQEPHAVRRPSDRLLGEAALERQRSLARAAGDVVLGQERRRRAQHPERGHRGQDEGQGHAGCAPGADERGEQERGRERQQRRRGDGEPRRGCDPAREGEGGRQERRRRERPLSHAR